MRFLKQNGKLLLLVIAAIMLGWIVLTLAVPPAAARPQSVQAVDLSWNVVGSGGSTMSSTSYTLLSTSGQPVAGGPDSSASYNLLSGYWVDLRDFLSNVLLPVVVEET